MVHSVAFITESPDTSVRGIVAYYTDHWWALKKEGSLSFHASLRRKMTARSPHQFEYQSSAYPTTREIKNLSKRPRY